jgi:para-nitrobenzyl esterase
VRENHICLITYHLGYSPARLASAGRFGVDGTPGDSSSIADPSNLANRSANTCQWKLQDTLIILSLALFALIGTAKAVRAGAGNTVITTQEGRVTGMRRNGVREFLGIPYAAPPIRELRWRPPEPHQPWKTLYASTHMGPSCPQALAVTAGLATAEDCLFLNVYAPDSARSGLPVMVWIHGGAFILGSGSAYDGSALVRKHELIVVTINYRLGALGFLALRSLEAESSAQVAGNYGLLDQQAALKWVKRNIPAFGGDPGKVTIAGESAGGISVCDQLLSPGASGLFRGAIIESGPCMRQATMAEREKTGRALMTKLGCGEANNEAACLRAKTDQQVLAAMPGSLQGPLLWAPVVDGHVLPMQPVEAFRSGNFNKVPVINGSNRDEGSLFVAFGKPLSVESYPAAIASFARAHPADGRSLSDDNNSARVLAEYPLESYQSPSEGLAAVLGDAIFSCPIEQTNELMSTFVPSYEYEFNDRHAPPTLMPYPPFPLGAYHASEIQYVFQTYFPASRTSGKPNFLPAQLQLSDHMADYWSRFIATGHPDGTSPIWSPAKPPSMKILSLSPGGIRYEPDFMKAHHCALWNSLRPEPEL